MHAGATKVFKLVCVSFAGFGFNGLWRFAGPFSKVPAPAPSSADATRKL